MVLGPSVPTLRTEFGPSSIGVRRRRDRVAASAFLALSALLLWVWPALGVILLGLSLFLLGPWGMTLGERAVISTGVGLGVIAAVFSMMGAVGHVVSPTQWRLLATAGLAAMAWGALGRRRVPLWVRPSLVDGLAIAGGGGVVVILGWSLRSATPARAMGILMSRWDNTSHLAIFDMVFHAQSWDLTRLGPKPMFYPYPSLHAATWSVIEWLAGAPATTSGAHLLLPYAWLSVATVGWAGALFVWAAALLARRAASPAKRKPAETVAAALAAVWVALGALPEIGMDGWANFLLAAALSMSTVAVSFARPESVVDTAWFLLPLSTLAIAYLYTPLAGVLAVALITVLILLARGHMRVVAAMAAVGGVAAAATLPALRILATPFRGEVAGALHGAIPISGFTIPSVAGAAVLLTVLMRGRRMGWAAAAAVVGLLAAPAAMTWYFAAQAAATHTPLASSYYTQKSLLSAMLVAVPTVIGLLSSSLVDWLGYHGPRVRSLLVRTAAVTALVVVTDSLPFLGVGVGGSPFGLGATAWHERQIAAAATSHPDEIGRWVLAAAAAQGSGSTLTITWRLDTVLPGTVADPVKADRVAAAFDHVATVTADHTYVSLGQPGSSGVVSIRRYLEEDTSRRLWVVVPDRTSAEALGPLVHEFGLTRLRVLQS